MEKGEGEGWRKSVKEKCEGMCDGEGWRKSVKEKCEGEV
jgi:hypothetical protein